MRLWQKVFLISLALVILTVNILSYVLLIRNHRYILVSIKENAAQDYSFAVTAIERAVESEKSGNGVRLLSALEVADIISQSVDSLQSEKLAFEVSTIDIPYHSVALFSIEERRYNSELIRDAGAGYYISTASTLVFQGVPYRLTMQKNVTEVMNSLDGDISYVQYAGAIISIGIAGVLLIVLLYIMRPLKTINIATKRISEGDYGSRLTIRSHDELAELAHSMNIMAGQIESHAKNREKFIADMAHELKTPLTSILGFADILKIKDDITNEERRDYAAIINVEASRLKSLSSRLLELICIDEIPLELTRANVKDTLIQLLNSMESLATQKKLELRLDAEDAALAEFDIDTVLFASLINNIVDNSAKASAPGQIIDITAFSEGDSIKITIQDYGAGIPRDKLEHVTQAFYRVDSSRAGKTGGAGIGLALCASIIRAHHGTMHIESNEGAGTVVTLVFPKREGVSH